MEQLLGHGVLAAVRLHWDILGFTAGSYCHMKLSWAGCLKQKLGEATSPSGIQCQLQNACVSVLVDHFYLIQIYTDHINTA